MGDVTFHLSDRTVIIHDRDRARNDRFDPQSDTVEVRRVTGGTAGHQRIITDTYRGYQAAGEMRRLGISRPSAVDFGQLRNIATHLNAAASAASDPSRLRDAWREITAARVLMGRNHINSSHSVGRSALGNAIYRIERAATSTEIMTFRVRCREVMTRLAEGSLRGPNAFSTVNALITQNPLFVGVPEMTDMRRLLGLIYSAGQQAQTGNSAFTSTSGQITEILNRYGLPTTRLEELSGLYTRYRVAH